MDAFFPLRYFKISDPGAWINMDRTSGELKVANTIDRESKYVKDGLYTIPVKAVDTSKSMPKLLLARMLYI